jgi:hypothetical protein
MILTSGQITPKVVKAFGIAPALGSGVVMASLSLYFIYKYNIIVKEVEDTTQ